ncbi:VapE domain-containing protein, partial [Oscillibacter sp.]|uniref:VapE domain-containing protein n=1 Tax=Oscillibacter sp. TaxID=1945593 RepID=UPI00289E9573
LVRLHKFGDQDDDAAPGTFTNQLPSYKTMLDLCKRDASVSDLLNKENGEKILEAFQKTETGNLAAGNDAQLAMFLGGLKGEVLTTDVVRHLMGLLGIQIKLNEVTWHVELSGYPKTWSRANAENLLPVRLLDHLRLAGVKGAAKNTVADCLDVIAEENRFNPVTDMFRSTQWDGVDRVQELYDIWGVSSALSRTLIRKWLLQCVAMACNDEYAPQGADGILVLQGDQGVGKTSALRQLVPLPRMFKEGAKLDLRVKDTYMQALNAWICELGELDRTTARDSAGLKAFLTQDMDEYRTPYAKKAVQRPRRTSFCGTVNPGEYLIDDTGNRRFWTVSVNRIDLSRLFAITNEWKTQLWAQMASEYQALPGSFRLSSDDRKLLENINVEHTRSLDFEDELRDLLNFDLDPALWGEFTSAQIATKLEARPPANRLGRVLAKLAAEDPRIIARLRDGRKMYRLPLLSNCVVSTFPTEKREVEHR